MFDMSEQFDQILPTIFLGLMAVSIFIYAILDGYDLGVGILIPLHNEDYRDKMTASSTAPFWGVNETYPHTIFYLTCKKNQSTKTLHSPIYPNELGVRYDV